MAVEQCVFYCRCFYNEVLFVFLAAFSFQYPPNAIHSAKMQTGMAAKISTTECCFTKATEIQIIKQKTVISVLDNLDTDFSFKKVDAIPIEYATCKEGHTFVLVSNL